MWGLFWRVGCEVLVMCARNDILWSYVKYVKEIASDNRKRVNSK
jgi:hypothetical protein